MYAFEEESEDLDMQYIIYLKKGGVIAFLYRDQFW